MLAMGLHHRGISRRPAGARRRRRHHFPPPREPARSCRDAAPDPVDPDKEDSRPIRSVPGVPLKKGEVAYFVMDGVGLVEPRRGPGGGRGRGSAAPRPRTHHPPVAFLAASRMAWPS